SVLALKTLSPRFAEDEAFVKRFDREARVMAQLRHPHIARIVDFDSEGQLLFFVMEYVAGSDVKEILRRQGRIALADALELTRQVAEALVSAHAQGILHRDIKPSNILVEHASGRRSSRISAWRSCWARPKLA